MKTLGGAQAADGSSSSPSPSARHGRRRRSERYPKQKVERSPAGLWPEEVTASRSDAAATAVFTLQKCFGPVWKPQVQNFPGCGRGGKREAPSAAQNSRNHGFFKEQSQNTIRSSHVEFPGKVRRLLRPRGARLTPTGLDGDVQTLSCPYNYFIGEEKWGGFFLPQQKLFEGHVRLLSLLSFAMQMSDLNNPPG